MLFSKIKKINTGSLLFQLVNLPDTQILHQHTSWWLVWCQGLPGKQKHSKMFKFGSMSGEFGWAISYSNYDHFGEGCPAKISTMILNKPETHHSKNALHRGVSHTYISQNLANLGQYTGILVGKLQIGNSNVK